MLSFHEDVPTCCTEEYLASKSDHQENEHSSLRGSPTCSIVNSNLSNTDTKKCISVTFFHSLPLSRDYLAPTKQVYFYFKSIIQLQTMKCLERMTLATLKITCKAQKSHFQFSCSDCMQQPTKAGSICLYSIVRAVLSTKLEQNRFFLILILIPITFLF